MFESHLKTAESFKALGNLNISCFMTGSEKMKVYLTFDACEKSTFRLKKKKKDAMRFEHVKGCILSKQLVCVKYTLAEF